MQKKLYIRDSFSLRVKNWDSYPSGQFILAEEE